MSVTEIMLLCFHYFIAHILRRLQTTGMIALPEKVLRVFEVSLNSDVSRRGIGVLSHSRTTGFPYKDQIEELLIVLIIMVSFCLLPARNIFNFLVLISIF